MGKQQSEKKDRNSLAAKIGAIRNWMEQVARTVEANLQRFQGDLITYQHRFNSLWNVTNALVRVIEKTGTQQGWWKDREEFHNLYAEAVREVMMEAVEHERQQIEKMKQGQPAEPQQTEVTELASINKEVIREHQSAEEEPVDIIEESDRESREAAEALEGGDDAEEA